MFKVDHSKQNNWKLGYYQQLTQPIFYISIFNIFIYRHQTSSKGQSIKKTITGWIPKINTIHNTSCNKITKINTIYNNKSCNKIPKINTIYNTYLTSSEPDCWAYYIKLSSSLCNLKINQTQNNQQHENKNKNTNHRKTPT